MQKSLVYSLIVFFLLLPGITAGSVRDTSSVRRLIHMAARFDISTRAGLDSSLICLNEAGIIAQQLESQHHLYSVYDQFNRKFLQSG